MVSRRLGRHVIYEQEMVSRRTRRYKQRSWLLYRFLSGPMMDPSCRHALRNRGDDHLLPAITRNSRNSCCEDDDPCKSSSSSPQCLVTGKSKILTKYLVRLSCTRWLRTQKAPYNNPSLCFVDKHLLSPSDTSLHVWQENRTFRVNFSCRGPTAVSKATVDNNKVHKHSRFSIK